MYKKEQIKEPSTLKTTDLFKACKTGDIKELDNWHRAGWDFNALSSVMGAPLHIACNYGSIEAVKFLIDKNANINLKTATGQTPLMTCIFERSYKCLKALLNHGAQVNLKNNYGSTALVMALECNSFDIAGDLIEFGAEAWPFHMLHQERQPLYTLISKAGKEPSEFDDIKVRTLTEIFAMILDQKRKELDKTQFLYFLNKSIEYIGPNHKNNFLVDFLCIELEKQRLEERIKIKVDEPKTTALSAKI